MTLDPNNPTVRLWVAGVTRETEHRFDEALSLYMQAWDEASDDFELCIAAHYVARQQNSAADALQWNLEALKRADVAEDHALGSFTICGGKSRRAFVG